MKNRIAYIFIKQYIWRDVIRTVLSKYTYVGVAILNIFLFDLDRHLHSPISKMVALNANIATYQSYMYSANGADFVMEYDVGNAYHIMIIIKLKHNYVVVENMKFNSNR